MFCDTDAEFNQLSDASMQQSLSLPSTSANQPNPGRGFDASNLFPNTHLFDNTPNFDNFIPTAHESNVEFDSLMVEGKERNRRQQDFTKYFPMEDLVHNNATHGTNVILGNSPDWDHLFPVAQQSTGAHSTQVQNAGQQNFSNTPIYNNYYNNVMYGNSGSINNGLDICGYSPVTPRSERFQDSQLLLRQENTGNGQYGVSENTSIQSPNQNRRVDGTSNTTSSGSYLNNLIPVTQSSIGPQNTSTLRVQGRQASGQHGVSQNTSIQNPDRNRTAYGTNNLHLNALGSVTQNSATLLGSLASPFQNLPGSTQHGFSEHAPAQRPSRNISVCGIKSLINNGVHLDDFSSTRNSSGLHNLTAPTLQNGRDSREQVFSYYTPIQGFDHNQTVRGTADHTGNVQTLNVLSQRTQGSRRPHNQPLPPFQNYQGHPRQASFNHSPVQNVTPNPNLQRCMLPSSGVPANGNSAVNGRSGFPSNARNPFTRPSMTAGPGLRYAPNASTRSSMISSPGITSSGSVVPANLSRCYGGDQIINSGNTTYCQPRTITRDEAAQASQIRNRTSQRRGTNALSTTSGQHGMRTDAEAAQAFREWQIKNQGYRTDVPNLMSQRTFNVSNAQPVQALQNQRRTNHGPRTDAPNVMLTQPSLSSDAQPAGGVQEGQTQSKGFFDGDPMFEIRQTYGSHMQVITTAALQKARASTNPMQQQASKKPGPGSRTQRSTSVIPHIPQPPINPMQSDKSAAPRRSRASENPKRPRASVTPNILQTPSNGTQSSTFATPNPPQSSGQAVQSNASATHSIPQTSIDPVPPSISRVPNQESSSGIIDLTSDEVLLTNDNSWPSHIEVDALPENSVQLSGTQENAIAPSGTTFGNQDGVLSSTQNLNESHNPPTQHLQSLPPTQVTSSNRANKRPLEAPDTPIDTRPKKKQRRKESKWSTGDAQASSTEQFSGSSMNANVSNEVPTARGGGKRKRTEDEPKTTASTETGEQNDMSKEGERPAKQQRLGGEASDPAAEIQESQEASAVEATTVDTSAAVQSGGDTVAQETCEEKPIPEWKRRLDGYQYRRVNGALKVATGVDLGDSRARQNLANPLLRPQILAESLNAAQIEKAKKFVAEKGQISEMTMDWWNGQWKTALKAIDLTEVIQRMLELPQKKIVVDLDCSKESVKPAGPLTRLSEARANMPKVDIFQEILAEVKSDHESGYFRKTYENMSPEDRELYKLNVAYKGLGRLIALSEKDSQEAKAVSEQLLARQATPDWTGAPPEIIQKQQAAAARELEEQLRAAERSAAAEASAEKESSAAKKRELAKAARERKKAENEAEKEAEEKAAKEAGNEADKEVQLVVALSDSENAEALPESVLAEPVSSTVPADTTDPKSACHGDNDNAQLHEIQGDPADWGELEIDMDPPTKGSLKQQAETQHADEEELDGEALERAFEEALAATDNEEEAMQAENPQPEVSQPESASRQSRGSDRGRGRGGRKGASKKEKTNHPLGINDKGKPPKVTKRRGDLKASRRGGRGGMPAKKGRKPAIAQEALASVGESSPADMSVAGSTPNTAILDRATPNTSLLEYQTPDTSVNEPSPNCPHDADSDSDAISWVSTESDEDEPEKPKYRPRNPRQVPEPKRPSPPPSPSPALVAVPDSLATQARKLREKEAGQQNAEIEREEEEREPGEGRKREEDERKKGQAEAKTGEDGDLDSLFGDDEDADGYFGVD